jgi:hypothetical protein
MYKIPITRREALRTGVLTFASYNLWSARTHSAFAQDEPQKPAHDADWDRRMWKQYFTPRLKQKLWVGHTAYTTAHTYMVPLHAAFLLDEKTWQEEITDLFQRYMSEGAGEPAASGTLLNRMQFLYFVSRYVVLAQRTQNEKQIPEGLVERLYSYLEDAWSKRPVIQWEHADFNCVRDRLTYKLDLKNPKLSYFRAILDEEIYIGAVAADLLQYERLKGEASLSTPMLREILEMMRRVWRDRADQNEHGGWIFQPGVWDDHPDFAYSDQTTKTVGMEKRKRTGLGEDISHSHRLPLWLCSFMEASEEESEDRAYYAALLKGLEKQFFAKALVPPTETYKAYRTHNYLDGSNGMYRWEYASLAPHSGYGPYELSGTLTLGWWVFLNTPRATQVFVEMDKLFPLNEEATELYLGPASANSTPESVAEGKAHINFGMRPLVVHLASRLGDKLPHP